MALHALENVDDAFDVAREFLFPFAAWRWLKLAVVTFFVGGAAGFPSGQFGTGGSPDPDPGPGGGGGGGGRLESVVDVPPVVAENLLVIAIGLVVAVVLLGAAFALVAAVMEFVLIESLRSGDVTLRRYWRRRWRQGLRLFAFRVAIGLPVLALFGAWLLTIVLPFVLGTDPLLSLGVFFLLIPVVFLVGLGYWLVSTLTTAFVVPIMIQEDSGVLAAWRRLWTSMRSETKQYLGFLALWVVLGFVASLIAAFAVGLLAVAVLIPLGLLGLLTYVTVSFGTTLGLAVLALLVVAFLVAIVVFGALVQVPIVTYLRYYALLVLGDVEPDLDLVADRRPEETP